MLKKGKRTLAWERIRWQLKGEFLRMGITFCEADWPHHCWRDTGLGFAHSKKRRYIISDDDWREVVLLCPIAHDAIERLPQKEMCEIVRKIINNRKQKQNEQFHRYDAD